MGNTLLALTSVIPATGMVAVSITHIRYMAIGQRTMQLVINA